MCLINYYKLEWDIHKNSVEVKHEYFITSDKNLELA